MKAMVITNFGSPEVFAESEVDKPTPENNEVLVKVYGTSVNQVEQAHKTFEEGGEGVRGKIVVQVV